MRQRLATHLLAVALAVTSTSGVAFAKNDNGPHGRGKHRIVRLHADRRAGALSLRDRQLLPPGLAKRDRLPPGLARHRRARGHLPPGLQKRLTFPPPPLELRRPVVRFRRVR